jgi:hypothetical protein
MRYGIGFKLGLLLASFGIVAMGTVGYYSYSGSRATLLAATQRDLLTATQMLGCDFQARIDSPAIAAVHEGVAAERDKRQLLDTFMAMMAVHPEYFQIRLIGADQHGLERVRVDRDGAKLDAVRATALQEKAHYPYVFNTLQLSRGQGYLSDTPSTTKKGHIPG